MHAVPGKLEKEINRWAFVENLELHCNTIKCVKGKILSIFPMDGTSKNSKYIA
jgi:hypothetical protein